MEQGEQIQAVRKEIEEAEMVLVGLGEEFDDIRAFRRDPGYREGKVLLMDSGQECLLPAWQRFFREKDCHREAEELMDKGLRNLARVLAEKDYFVASVSTNGAVRGIPWKEGRLVTPCGSDLGKQCGAEDACGVRPLEPWEREELRGQMEKLEQDILRGEKAEAPRGLGLCPECGEPQALNNIYYDRYDESGYLADWESYTKWLQGTLKHKILVLELGVGMQFPNVIRFPFEKVAYFNQKAKFYRVNEKLYQLTEELAEKGVSIAKNAIDWLQNL